MQTEIETTREIDYSMEDPAFAEPFDVYKSANAWWISDKAGRVKVEKLIQAFKQCMKVNQAIVLAGISQEQWQYFNEIHPKFYSVRLRCEELANMFAKSKIVDTIKSDWKAAAWFLERREPDMFGRRENAPIVPVQGGSTVTAIMEAFVDKDGKLISKRKTVTISNGPDTTTNSTA